MYLMYVDESGDPGLVGSPTKYFALTGIVVHESRWRELQEKLLDFRRTMRKLHGLPIKTEIHAAPYLRSPPIPGMLRHVRLAILRNMIDELAKMDFISITNVVIDKSVKPTGFDVFETAWKFLFQRFENTVSYGNFPGGYRSSTGMVFVDDTNGDKLNKLMRRMSVYNPVPIIGGVGYKQMPMVRVIEDPTARNSSVSRCIQAADVCAYFLHQKFAPNSYVRKSGARAYFDRLDPVLNKRASINDAQGIVRY